MATGGDIYSTSPDSTFFGSSQMDSPSEVSPDHMDIYRQSQHASHLLTALAEIRAELDLIDLHVQVGGNSYPCHRAVLAAGSPYYKEVLAGEDGDQGGTGGRPQQLEERQLGLGVVQQVVSYVYTGTVTISEETSQLLLLACFNQKAFGGRVVESAVSDFVLRQKIMALDSAEEDFKQYNFASDILKALNRLRMDGEFIDVVIKVSDECFPCHKVVLAASSAYFKAMFSSKMRETEEGCIVLNGLHPSIVRALINYTYSGKLTIGTTDAQEMMATASFLHHKSAMVACSEFMTAELHPSNCLGMLQFGQDIGCRELHQEALRFSLANFLRAREHEEFNEMSADLLGRLIESDDLNVKKEEQVYEAVMQWVHHDKEERLYHLCELVQKIRLPLIDAAYTSRFIESDSLLKRWPSAVVVVDEAKKMKLAACRGDKVDDVRMKLRFSMKKEVMVVVGGFTDNQQWVRNVRCYNPENGAWIELAPFPGRNQRFQCVAVKNDIYVIGGQAENQAAHLSETLSDVWKYDSILDKWFQVASLNKPRHGHGSAVLDGKIYVVGGKIGWSKKFNEVERYDPQLNIWSTIGRIKGNFVERPIVTPMNGKLYIMGYFFRDPDLIHCFDPHTNIWTQIPSTHRLYGDGIENAVILKNFVYYMIYRGFDNHIIAYDPISHDRFHGKLMPEGKYLHSYGITTVADKIWISGGSRLDAGINISYVECYDPEVDMWIRVAIMPLPLCEHGCVTIHKYIPN